MCISAFVWQSHPLYHLLLLQNRDEYHNRGTMPAAWWKGCDILGGRDEVAGGTWLGCSGTGRVAFLTNVMEFHTSPDAKSRGDLPVRFLESTKSPKEFAEELKREGDKYNGFNLVVADIPSQSMFYVTNRPSGHFLIQEVPPGIHVLSNADLDSPWHKTQRLGLNFKEMVSKYDGDIPAKEMVEKLMKDKVKAEESRLPHILALDWEYDLSSIFVEVDTPLGMYGTRSTIALTIRANGDASFYEIYLEKGIWKEHTLQYHIQKHK